MAESRAESTPQTPAKLDGDSWATLPEHLGLLVTRGAVPDSLPGADWLDDWIQISGDTILLYFSDSLRMLVRSGRHVTVEWDDELEPGKDPSWVLYGWAVRLAALQRGTLSLHAATVEIDGVLVGVAGKSGAGKSTTAMGLRRRGHSLLSDDVSLLDVREDGVWTTPCGPSVNLLPDAAEALGLDFEQLTPLAGGRDKSALRIENPPVEPRRLDLVVVLAPEEIEGDHQSVHLREVRGADRLRELIGHTLLDSLAPKILGPDVYFTLLAGLAHAVPVVILERSADQWSLDTVVEAIEGLAKAHHGASVGRTAKGAPKGSALRVESSDAEVRRLIVRIADTVRLHGGFVHDDLVIHHDGPQLWTALPGHADSPTILRIPRALHVPVLLDTWPEDADTLRPPEELGDLTQVQRTLLLTMVDLFNACDKVLAVGRSYPNIALADDPELQALIAEARPSWATLDRASPSHNFMGTRLGSDGWGSGEDCPPHLMPMIDLINHHPAGAMYEYVGEVVAVRAHRHGAGDEVFLRYNDYDALAIALNLGYFESATRFVASIPCTVEVPDLGIVEVEGVDLDARSMPAPAVEATGDGLRLVGLQLGAETVDAVRVMLSMAIRSRRPGLDEPGALRASHDTIRHLVETNHQYFTRLSVVRDRQPDPWSLRPLLRAAADHQVALLDGVRARLAQL